MNKRIFITTVVAIFVVSGIVAFGLTRRTATAPQNDDLNAKASIREKARAKGHYIGLARPVETTQYDDVESLTKASTLVVRGLVQQQKSFVPATNERLVVTAYELLVQDVLKGNVKTGESISVETLGGTVQFEDGTIAEMKVPEIMKNPELGKAYLFFLRPHKSAFRLVGGPQGLFEVTVGGKLKPQVPADDKLMKKYGASSLDELSRTIRDSARARHGL